MSERAAFLTAIAADVYDDTRRLAYADWLDEHKAPARAEFIRVQCELEPIRDRYEIDRAVELHKREDSLLLQHRDEWLGKMPRKWDRYPTEMEIEFRRGFPDTLLAPVRGFLEHGETIRKRHPTIRRIVLFRLNGYGERVAACPALDGLAELELACWYGDNDAEALAVSPHLKKLQVLELWLGRRRPRSDARLCELFAGLGQSGLRELTLLNPDNGKRTSQQRLVGMANFIAGREFAVYRDGYPKLFPLAADIGYGLHPGRLPNGRTALAHADSSTNPATLCVITFDGKGKQTNDVIRVPMPASVLAAPTNRWYTHEKEMRQQLIDVLDFRPGFIRVQEYELPGDKWGGMSPVRGHDDIWEEQLGVPDTDDEEGGNEYPRGNGGQVHWVMRNGEWILGWDRWGDKRGHIHST